jgi:tetratricopeptide (TPR) repeat protein
LPAYRSTVLAVLTVLVLAAAPACRGGGANASASPDQVPLVPVDPNSGSATDRAIASAQAKLRLDLNDPAALLDLAAGYLQKAREVADPSLYTKTAAILALVRKQEPGNLTLLITEGSLANAQHRFHDGLKLGRQAVAAAPGTPAAYGVVVDAADELGLYGEALTAVEKMADIRPDLTALSRVSYARELRGDLPGAVLAMSQAVTAGGTAGGENVAYVQVLLGDLLLNTGQVAGAEEQYEAALQSFPGFGAARVGQAKVLVAQGKPGPAGDLLAQVVKIQPLAEYAIAEGDDYQSAGQTAKAADAYALVGVIERLYAANGVNVDLELALFDADHKPGTAALAQARKGFQARSSYLGHETVAWNLYRIGRVAEAVKEIHAALAIGDRDPLLRYHAAVIFDAAGNRQEAMDNLNIVIQDNPRFSALYANNVVALASKYGVPIPPAS